MIRLQEIHIEGIDRKDNELRCIVPKIPFQGLFIRDQARYFQYER